MNLKKINPEAPVKEMTIRTEIASRILANMVDVNQKVSPNMLSYAVRLADALIAELNKDSE